jgi:glutaredoxin
VSDRILTLYGRKDCTLCEHMVSALKSHLSANGVRLQIVDVDSDPALRARFDWDVPLVFAGEREICRHELDVIALKTWLLEV